MKRRVISFLLSLAILFGVVCMGAPVAHAAYDMKASEDIIALIKEFEGFADKPYQDNGQWSVGYGTGVSGSDLTKYQSQGITREEADTLMRRYLMDFETDVNAFAQNFGLKLSQQQFDALVSFTYNLGSNWTNNDSTFRQAVVGGASGADFLYAIARWSSASGNVLKSLVERRLAEANVYLNGVYEKNPPSNYRYVIYNENTEKPYVNDIRVQAFYANNNVTLKAQPTKTGNKFLGWYTSATGGEWITALKAGSASRTLYGHWQSDSDANASVNGTAASYQRIVGTSASDVVRETPSKSAAEKQKLSEGTTVSITADYIDGEGVKWGKLSSGGWVMVYAAAEKNEPLGKPISPLKIKVTGNDINIRTGPGTSYGVIGQVDAGEELTITEVGDNGTTLWGNSEIGWICLKYTNYDQVLLGQEEDSNEVTATGKVYRTDKLNIRSGPGTKYAKVGQLSKGDTVQITLQQSVGSSKWGKISAGWISMYYVDQTAVDTAPTEPEATEPAPTEPAPTEPPAEEETPEDTDKFGTVPYSGMVSGAEQLNVRKAPGTKSDKVGTLKEGTLVTILEEADYYGSPWGRIKTGWISLRYIVEPPASKPVNPEEPGEQPKPEGNGETPIDSGVVVRCTLLNVRKGPGTHNAKVSKLAVGTPIYIYEKKMVGSQEWGRTNDGWISLYYFSSDSEEAPPVDTPSEEKPADKPSGETPDSGTTGTGKVGTVIRTSVLNIREKPGAKNEKVGEYIRGTQVVILEQEKYNGKYWGRTDKGWVHMYYIQLGSESSGSSSGSASGSGSSGSDSSGSGSSGSTTQTRQLGTIVNTPSLTVRKGPGTKYDKVTTLQKGTPVVILETTTNGKTTWGRTEQGWISMYYVKLSNETVSDTATVRTVNTNELNIRSAPGASNEKVGTYTKGDQILILEQQNYNGKMWGRTDKGWICMYYTK